tara:strand:- start:138 stop:419 length:282 start_codon:yes stop_codon:yes gene_type:complete
MLRRAQYIKHPSQVRVPAKQKKDWARGLPVHRCRSASAIRYANTPARVSLGHVCDESEREFANRSDEQHRALRTRSATATRIVLRVRSDHRAT